MKSTPRSRLLATQGGFTLVELLVTMVVASILFAIAIPTYTNSIRKSRRTDARSALLDLAGREERYMSTNTAYTNLQANLGYAASGSTATLTNLPVGSGYYQISVSVPDPNQAINNSFLATATAVGGQTADGSCATLSINQLGQQTATGSDPNANTVCWQ